MINCYATFVGPSAGGFFFFFSLFFFLSVSHHQRHWKITEAIVWENGHVHNTVFWMPLHSTSFEFCRWSVLWCVSIAFPRSWHWCIVWWHDLSFWWKSWSAMVQMWTWNQLEVSWKLVEQLWEVKVSRWATISHHVAADRKQKTVARWCLSGLASWSFLRLCLSRLFQTLFAGVDMMMCMLVNLLALEIVTLWSLAQRDDNGISWH